MRDLPWRVRRIGGRVALYAFAYLVMATVLIPLTFAVLGGFRSNQALAMDPVGLPDPWDWTRYASLATSAEFLRQVLNSTVIALLTTAVVLPAASMAAFAIARARFAGREALYGLFTLGLLFPAAVAILPLFILLRDIGLLSSRWGVILPQAAFGLPLAIVIMRPFFAQIPSALYDAARIDGCGPFTFYWRILLPLSRPVLSTVWVITIVGSWNAFLLPLLVLIDKGQQTLPLGVNNISTAYSTDYARVLAYATLSIIPALVFYAFAERQIIGGLTAGAVKE
jgi:raffinose/stachyose/melibiose transport system permease protein